MKRYIILFCAILLFNINVVNADNTYKCQYFNDEGTISGFNPTYQFRFVVNTDKNTILFENIPKEERKKADWNPALISFLIDPVIDSSYSDEYYINKFKTAGKNTCPETVNICEIDTTTADDTPVIKYGILFNNSLIDEIPSYVYIKSDSNGEELFPPSEAGLNKGILSSFKGNCVPFAFDDGEYSGKGTSVVISYVCNRYTNNEKTGLKDDVEAKSNAYKDCEKKNDSGCSLEKLATEYNQAVEKLKSYCNNVIQNQNYGDACMTSCLGMIDDLKSLEIEKTTETNECYLTDEIISFVYNVLKYAKYIAPVLAIILSILDFIKAIAASSEDEMKKAQGKFIKRLIVAALLFLIPLIINFLLQTFGVYNTKCDIGDLFS